MAEEGLQRTENDLIHIGKPVAFETDEFLARLRELMDAAYKNKPGIRELVREIVSTYHPAPEAPLPAADRAEKDDLAAVRA